MEQLLLFIEIVSFLICSIIVTIHLNLQEIRMKYQPKPFVMD